VPDPLEYRILGPLEVLRAGRPIPISRGRLRALLGSLLLAAGEPVSVLHLVDAVWGPASPASADDLVRVYVSQLRQLLGDGVVLTKPGGYVVDDPGDRLDAERFRRLVALGAQKQRDGDDESAAECFDAAVKLWSGDVLADTPVAGDAAAAAARLAELRLHAIETSAASKLRLARHPEVVADLEREVAANPTRERLIAELMVALYRSDRQTDALALYSDIRLRLVNDLGLDPSPRLQELQTRILNHDPTLASPTFAEESPATSRRRIMVAATGVVVAIAFGGGGWLLARPQATPVVGTEGVVGIDSAHVRVERVGRLSGSPGALRVSADGIWVVDTAKRKLQELDPRLLTVRRRVMLRTLPHTMLAVGGHLWLANESDGTISRVVADGIGPAIRPEPAATGRLAMAYGTGVLWIGSQDGRVTRFDPRLQRATAVVTGVRTPEALAVADDAVWVASATSVSLLRIDERLGRITARVPIGGVPSAIVFAAGSVWALAPEQGQIWRIDPRGNSVVGSISVPGASLLSAAGPTVWAANAANGTITRVFPASPTVISLSHPLAGLDGGPNGMLVATTR
jgi:DNA-binding SARP family transcriptional activator